MISNLKLKSKFARDTLTLMTGTAIAQAIPIATAPILTRIYTPEDFGLLALFLAIFSVLSVLATGRYELAIMAPASDSEAQNIVFLSMLVAFGVLVVSGIPIWIFNSEIANFFGNEQIGRWLYFIPLMIFFYGTYQSIDYWLNRQKKYWRMAENKLVQAGSVTLIQIIMGLISKTGLIIGSVIGWSMSVLYIIRRNKHQFNNYDFNEVKKLAIKYKDYPLFQAPTSMLDTLSVQAPIFFISKYFDAIIVGFFSLVLKILSAPAALIAKSTGQVFFQRVSEHAKTSPELLLNDIYNVALKLLIVAVLTFLPLLFYGPEIFAAVFGSDWAQAGTYAQILVYAVVIRFVVSPLSTIFLAIDKIKIGSLWQFLYFITTFIVLFIAINYEPKIFLWFYVVNELVMYAFYFGLMIYSVKSFVLSKELDK